MVLRRVYLLLMVPGVIVPWLFLMEFLRSGEAGVLPFFYGLFANSVASAGSSDLLISAVTFLILVYVEGRRLGMRRLWLYPLATFAIGLSFGLPLFLYHREEALQRDTGESA